MQINYSLFYFTYTVCRRYQGRANIIDIGYSNECILIFYILTLHDKVLLRKIKYRKKNINVSIKRLVAVMYTYIYNAVYKERVFVDKNIYNSLYCGNRFFFSKTLYIEIVAKIKQFNYK